MPFLTLKYVSVRNVNQEMINHPPQTVLSDWELEPFARQKILEGSGWYRERFEPLTEKEAQNYRVLATQAEQPHILSEGGAKMVIAPPFADYVGLHPTEIVARLKSQPVAVAMQARQYELAGMRREMITGFIHPAERVPFSNYDNMSVMDICDKLELLPDEQVAEAKVYEEAHQGRELIMTFEKEAVEPPVALEPVTA